MTTDSKSGGKNPPYVRRSVNIPLVIRTQCGVGLGNGAQHSQSLEAILAHVPGIRVVMPSNAYDAKGLLLHAIRDNNPVVFVEHKGLVQAQMRGPGRASTRFTTAGDIKREGKDVTIVTYSAIWVRCLIKGSNQLGTGRNRGGGSGYLYFRDSGYRDDRKSVKNTCCTPYGRTRGLYKRLDSGARDHRVQVQEHALEAGESDLTSAAAPILCCHLRSIFKNPMPKLD